jgi:hypothetical protein
VCKPTTDREVSSSSINLEQTIEPIREVSSTIDDGTQKKRSSQRYKNSIFKKPRVCCFSLLHHEEWRENGTYRRFSLLFCDHGFMSGAPVETPTAIMEISGK